MSQTARPGFVGNSWRSRSEATCRLRREPAGCVTVVRILWHFMMSSCYWWATFHNNSNTIIKYMRMARMKRNYDHWQSMRICGICVLISVIVSDGQWPLDTHGECGMLFACCLHAPARVSLCIKPVLTTYQPARSKNVGADPLYECQIFLNKCPKHLTSTTGKGLIHWACCCICCWYRNSLLTQKKRLGQKCQSLRIECHFTPIHQDSA